MKRYWTTALMVIALTASADDAITLKVTVKDGHFYPDRLEAQADKPIKIEINNTSQDAIEFESTSLRVEELIPANTQLAIEIMPLRSGQYNFFDDFHKNTGQGVLIVK
jgi:hypothetical protein